MLPRRSAGCTGTNLFTYYLALAEWGVKMHRNDIRISIPLATIEVKERKEGALRQAVNIERRVLGAGHPDTVDSVYKLARVLALTKKPDEAIALLGDAVDQGLDAKTLADLRRTPP